MSDAPLLITHELIAGKCPARPDSGHKGTFGRALICAGSPGMGGAAYMASSSALRSGAGLIYIKTARELLTPLMTMCPEALGISREDTSEDFETWFTQVLSDKDACLIGPGIRPDDPELYDMIAIAAKNARHLVLDAGALSCLAEHESLLDELKERSSRGLPPAVLTPHIGEFKRLMPGYSEEETERAGSFSEENGVVLVLKSHVTNVFTSDGKWYSNPVSNSGLAKGGSGDVLAGLLTGLLAQGMREEDAAVCAVGIHSLAGKLCAEEHGTRAMLPTMLWQYYDKCFKILKWEEGKNT